MRLLPGHAMIKKKKARKNEAWHTDGSSMHVPPHTILVIICYRGSRHMQHRVSNASRFHDRRGIRDDF